MFFRKKEPKSRFHVGQDVMDNQDMSVGQVVSVHEKYLEIADSAGSNKIYVPLEFISPIPRGEGIAITVSKAQLGIKSWNRPPQ